MIQVSENAEHLEMISSMPWGKRLLLVLLALIPLECNQAGMLAYPLA